MIRRTRAVAVQVAFLVSVWSVGALGVQSASAQTTDDLFDAHTVQELRIVINERDLKELRERYLENVYFPADLHWRGLHVQNVGVRSRGLASRSATKPGLRIDFNRYTSGQRFLGLASIALDNLVTDPTMVRERLAMAFFHHLGQPAPRETFSRVYINNVFQGLYAIVESIDGDFLTRTLGERNGYLFERRFMSEFRGEDLGDDPAAYRNIFEPKNHELEADTLLYSPIRDLFYEANQPLDSVWRDRVERYLDLEQLVTHVAIETFLSESDGILGYAGMANFYLYRSMHSDRHRFIVWDKDRAFRAIDSPIFQRVEENILLKRALAFEDLWTLYLDTLERCARLATADGWLASELRSTVALIEGAARDDISKPYGNGEVEQAREFLTQFVQERPAYVLAAVAKVRRER
jgi:spore coat protein CotH